MGVPIISPETQFQASQAMSHPIVYRIVNKIGEAVASVEWKVRKIPAVGAEPRKIRDQVEKQIEAVLEQPCDEVDAYSMRYWMAANLAIYGNAPTKISRTFDGQLPNAIYPLRNVQTQVVGDQSGRIVAYRFMSGDGPAFQLPSRLEVQRRERAGATTKEAYAAVLSKPGLDILSLDNSPTKAASLPIEIYLMLLQRARETASGHPNKKYIVVVDGMIEPAQEEQIYEMLNGSRVGAQRSGQIGFMSGTKAEIIDLDNDLSDLHSKMPSDDMARTIAGIWGVPAQLLGLGGADAAKYAANYIEGRAAYYEDTIVPGYLTPIASALTQSICPPGYQIYFDLESLEPLRDARLRRMNSAATVPFMTPNEKRALFDLPPMKGGDELQQAAPIQNKPPPPQTNDPPPESD